MLDPELLAFSMTGSKKINHTMHSPGPSLGIHWMNDVIWAELDALSKVQPFCRENIMDHIKENPAVWNQLFDHKHVAFVDLPNRQKIDLSCFFEKEPVMPAVTSKKDSQSKQVKSSVRQSKETQRESP